MSYSKMKYIPAIIFMLLLAQPIITFGQGTPVLDIANLAKNAESATNTWQSLAQLQEQYKKLKAQYDLAKNQVDKLKRISQSLINFTSGKAFMGNLIG